MGGPGNVALLSVPVTVELRSSASPERVLAAIHEEMREWRESALPKEIRSRAWRVAARIQGSDFTLYYESASEAAPDIVLRGRVTASAAGGSHVVATARLQKSYWISVAVLAAFALALWLAGGGGALWLVGVAAMAALVGWVRSRRLPGNDAEACHLTDRLRRAVDATNESLA